MYRYPKHTILRKIFNDYNWIERPLDIKKNDLGKILLYRYNQKPGIMVAFPIRIFRVLSTPNENDYMINLLKCKKGELILDSEECLWTNSVTNANNWYDLYELDPEELVLLKLELNI